MFYRGEIVHKQDASTGDHNYYLCIENQTREDSFRGINLVTGSVDNYRCNNAIRIEVSDLNHFMAHMALNDRLIDRIHRRRTNNNDIVVGDILVRRDTPIELISSSSIWFVIKREADGTVELFRWYSGRTTTYNSNQLVAMYRRPCRAFIVKQILDLLEL